MKQAFNSCYHLHSWFLHRLMKYTNIRNYKDKLLWRTRHR